MTIGSKNWVGAKGGSGVAQRIISEMPTHDVYLECFAGTGKIGLTKKPARSNIFIDTAAPIFSTMPPGSRIFRTASSFLTFTADTAHAGDISGNNVIAGDVISFLRSMQHLVTDRWLIYLDPPYLSSVRSFKKADYYRHEFKTSEQHQLLLSLILTIGAKVMISGYDSDLYNEMLKGWRKISIPTVKRSGARSREIVWMNFSEPIVFHDDRFLGNNYRERERIKRKKNRWRERLRKMDRLDRSAVIAALSDMINAPVDLTDI